MMTIERMTEIVEQLHGAKARHVGSEFVREEFRGELVWEGEVQVFELEGHPMATSAYAWTYLTDQGRERTPVVLKAGPVKSALDAVRAAILRS